MTLTKRWHRDVNTWYKRLWLTCKGSHTLLAGLFYRGSVGFSRAQTVMILSNSVVLELVVLCLQYDTVGEAEVNPNPNPNPHPNPNPNPNPNQEAARRKRERMEAHQRRQQHEQDQVRG